MAVDSIQYQFVKAAPTDAIVALYKEVGWWKEDPNSRDIIPAMILGSFCFMVVLVEGQIIGMGRVISDGYSDGYIQDVIVKKEYRGRGIGKALVKELTRYCVKARLGWVGLVAEPGTPPFYEPFGYKVRENYTFMLLQNREQYE